MSLTPNISKKFTSVSWGSVCMYAGLVAGALFLWWNLHIPTIVDGDAWGYSEYAKALINGQYEKLFTTFRPYGYPLFLAILIKIATLFQLPSVYPMIYAGQFILHLANATLATLMMRRFVPQARPWTLYLVFAAVAWNPYLLAMVTQLLSENLSIFSITLFFYWLQAEVLQSTLTNRAWIGVSLGLAAVTRPLNIAWAICVFGVLVIVAYLNMRALGRWRVIPHVKRLAQIGIFFVVVTLTQQIASSYFLSQIQDVSKIIIINDTSGVIRQHLTMSPYIYRIDNLYDREKETLVPIWYFNTRLVIDFFKPELILMPFVKLVGLFQQHNYEVYRPRLGIDSPIAFAVGLVYWIMFCYIVPQALTDIWQARGRRKPFPMGGLLTIVMLSYPALYAIFTIPEPRYLLSIYPVLVPLFAYYALRPTRWRHFIVPLVVAVVAYGLIAYTLLWAIENYRRP